MPPTSRREVSWRTVAARSASLVSIVLLAALLHGASTRVSDPDAFYHLRHAWVYRTSGIFDSAFPWAWFSVVRVEASDLWYGFHLLLVPFTLAPRLLDGLLAAGVCVTAGALALVLAALSRFGVRWPLAWTAAFAFSTGHVLFRLTMVRPQPLSLGLALLALAFACAEPQGPRERRAVFLLAFAAAWVHLALGWLVPMVAAMAVAARVAVGQRRGAASLTAAALAGALAGALLRPHPLGGLRLAWVQVVTFLELKHAGVPLPFGRELLPLPPLDAARLFVVPAALAVLLLVAWIVARRRGVVLGSAQRVAVAASLLLALTFAALTLTVASRSQELAAAFAVAGAAIVFTAVRAGARRLRQALDLGLVLALALLPLAAASPFAASAAAVGRPPAAFAPAARWLAAHARPGDLVFHLWWDQFPHLFFWNPAARYVNGMDPVFEYAFDPGLFWKTQGLASDRSPETTCARPSCAAGEREPTPLVLERDFGARWVVLNRGANPNTDAYLAASARFRRAFDDGTDVVYELLPAVAGPSGQEYHPLRSLKTPRR